MKGCMRNTCQFCDQNPSNLLQKFNRGWVCERCLTKYDLSNHAMLFNEVEISTVTSTASTQNYYTNYSDWGWDGYYDDTPYKQGLGYYSFPKKAIIDIEELVCNPGDLSFATSLIADLPNNAAAKIIKKAKKWIVEIW